MQTRKLTGYCNRDSPSPCNILSCLFAYTVKKIVAATDAANPITFKMICGAERKWCSCEASAKVRIKIPLQQQDPDEFVEIQRHMPLKACLTHPTIVPCYQRKIHLSISITQETSSLKRDFFYFYFKKVNQMLDFKGKKPNIDTEHGCCRS